MNQETFAKKLVYLRKKYHYTQQELADKLNISNKTISRWENAESYPDIELLPLLADIFQVSIDYLLTDQKNIMDLDKETVISYIPWIVALAATLFYYLFSAISIPMILCFIMYLFLVHFSYQFASRYTNQSDPTKLAMINAVTGFFVVASVTAQVLYFIAIFIFTGSIPIAMMDLQFDFDTSFTSYFVLSQFLSYGVAAIYAFFHYQHHSTSQG